MKIKKVVKYLLDLEFSRDEIDILHRRITHPKAKYQYDSIGHLIMSSGGKLDSSSTQTSTTLHSVFAFSTESDLNKVLSVLKSLKIPN